MNWIEKNKMLTVSLRIWECKLVIVIVKSLWLIKQKRNCNKRNGTLREINIAKKNSVLTHFKPMVYFYTPWKCQKTSTFLMFSGDTEIENLREMG